ncbi:MAG TPA: AI-2E family transporter [Kofleriaceae bacterium]|nr:AI-2E family transporter [Kofleriaceae bacterium]
MPIDDREVELSPPRRVETEPSRVRIEIAPRTILLLLVAVAGVWVALQLQTVLIVVTIALVMVGTLDPMVAWFERHGIRRGRALVLIFVAIAALVAGVLLLTVPPLVTQLLHLIEDAPRGRDRLIEWLRQYKLARPFVQTVKAVPVNDLVLRAGNTMVGYSADILTMVGYAISTTFLAIYLLADPVRSKGLIYAVVPRNHHIKLARILLELKVIVGGYMRGQLITSVAMAVFTFGVLTAFRVDDALPLALFAGMTDIIPFVGGYVASLPVILAVTPQGLAAVVIVFLLMFAYQEFESRILVPRVYGKVLRLPPAVVLVSLLVGGTVMGIIGALLALPIAAGLQMVVRELRVELPGETPPDAVTRARDQKAEDIYEQLTEGATAADAGVIASELAEKMKQHEKIGSTMTAEMPAIMADLAEDIAEPGAEAEIAEAVEETKAAESKAADRLDAPPDKKDSP